MLYVIKCYPETTTKTKNAVKKIEWFYKPCVNCLGGDIIPTLLLFGEILQLHNLLFFAKCLANLSRGTWLTVYGAHQNPVLSAHMIKI